MNYPHIIGKYYRALGWFSVLSTVLSFIACYWTDYLHLDLSFVIWLWLGRELIEGNNSARKWAIGISVFALALMILGTLVEGGNATFGSNRYESGTWQYSTITSLIFILLVLPGLSLLAPQARQQFTQ